MSDLSNTVRKSIQDFVEGKPLLLKLARVIEKSLIWDTPIAYVVIFALVLVNYIFITSTQWRTLPYIIILVLEGYVLNLVLTFLQGALLKATEEEGKESLNTILDTVFGYINSGCCKGEGECHDYIKDIAALKKFSETPYYQPTKTVLTLLLLALLSAIFPGSFIAFVVVFGILLAPGIINRKLHTTAYEKVWEPIILPQWNKNVQPQVDKYWAKLKGEQVPVEEPPAERSLPQESAPAAPSAPADDGGLDINNLLSSIGNLAQNLGDGDGEGESS